MTATAPPSPTDVPCDPWLDPSTLSCGTETIDPAKADAAVWTASTWLWRLTGKVYGVCEVTVLPLGQSGCNPLCSGYDTWYGSWYFDRSRNCWYGANGRFARNEGWMWGVPEVRLGFQNVQEIVQVQIDGEVLDPAAYRVDDGRWLVRLDGKTWPYNQDVRVTPPNFAVTLRHGLPVTADGAEAARVLACELLLAQGGSATCRLPKRVTSITRQGVSMVLLDPLTIMDEGKFGIAEVDYFVKSVNPYGNRQRAKVVSPDVPRSVRIPTHPAAGPLQVNPGP